MLDASPHEYKETVGTCTYCGNSPVNHVEAYISHTFSVWSSTLALRRMRGPTGTVTRTINRALDRIAPVLFWLLRKVRLASVAHDEQKANTYRSQVVWEEAKRRGIPMEQLTFFGKRTELYRAHVGGKWHYFQSLPTPPHLYNDRVEWIDDKFLLKRAFEREGIPAPVSISVCTLRGARDAFFEIGKPVVVKPRSGSRGRHTTVNVTSIEQLEAAYKIAKQLCHYVVVEEYLEGAVCRGTVVGGKLAGFFQASPPRLVGDGASTIDALIERHNAVRPDRVQPIVLTEEHERFIERLGLSRHSVLPLGRVIALTHRTGRLFGGRTRELFGKEHPELRAYIERAAAVCEAPIVGFDLIIENPELPPGEQSWGIIEANSLPYIDLHYLPLDGEPTNVAAAVWNLWDAVHKPVDA